LRTQTRSPKHTIDVKNLEEKFFYKNVSEEGKTCGGKDGDRGGGEKTHLKPMKRTRSVKTVKYLKIYER